MYATPHLRDIIAGWEDLDKLAEKLGEEESEADKPPVDRRTDPELGRVNAAAIKGLMQGPRQMKTSRRRGRRR